MLVQARLELGSNYRSIQHSVISPAFKVCLVGIFCSGFLVDIDAPTRLIVRIDIALADIRRPGKYFAGFFIEEGLFLDTEVGGGEIEMQIVTMADRINVVGPVPGSSYIEEFAAMGHFSAHVETTDRGLMNANE